MSERSITVATKSAALALSQTPSGLLQRKCACGQHTMGGECESCGRQRTFVQRQTAGQPVPQTVPPIVHEVLQSPGKRLDADTQVFFQSRFGQDFSGVRVHTDTRAGQSARAVDANAFAAGRNIVFAESQYAPRTQRGISLLAHELTHVVQQSRVSDRGHQAMQLVEDAPAEREAAKLSRSNGGLPSVTPPSQGIQREPTQPRAATASQSVQDVNKQLATPPAGKVTAGSLARQEWESLFKRHFTEPDKVEGEVESVHARYLYSRIYGWIDAQHFFAHIQFAEDSGVEAATAEGIGIEQKQQMVRDLISKTLDDTDIFGDLLTHNLADAADFMHYRETLFIAMALAMNHFLSKQQADLIKGFSDEQLAKLILDNAISAWSYEDLVSNQLGVQFFRLYGAEVNAAADAAAVRARFVQKITEYFAAIEVVDDPVAVKRLAKGLPGKERWTAPKVTEAQARKKFPELFQFSATTHRVRVSLYDLEKEAQKGKEAVEKSVPGGLPAGMSLAVAPFGSKFALCTRVMSHFEAVVYKHLIDRAVRTGAGGALVEPVASASPGTK